MSVSILVGDVRDQLATLPADSIDCCVTSPPYWGLRDYGGAGQIGLEPTLGEHLDVMVDVFEAVKRVLKPEGTLWLNYGDCYATKPNGRSAAATKAAGTDDRTFRDKPFSTVGPIRAGRSQNLGNTAGDLARRNAPGPIYDPSAQGRRNGAPNVGGVSVKGESSRTGAIVAGGLLKPKDLCMIPNRLAIALQDAGWWVRSEIVWGKPNPMPDSSGRYRPSTAHEKIFPLTKSAKSFYDHLAVSMPTSGNSHARESKGYKMPDGWDTGPGGHGSHHRQGREKGRPPGVTPKSVPETDRFNRAKESFYATTTALVEQRFLRNFEPDLVAIVPPEVWEIATAPFSEAHFATFPPALVAPCLLAGCPVGGTVLDPFGGAGTTGLVADRMQRNAILIELNPEYASLAERRLSGDRGMLLDAMEAA